MTSVTQKSQLAKLMATENITVEHKKTRTAYFDVKNRVLACPIWQEMSGPMYDHLLGHEVGHALYTPLEGWHDAVKESQSANYKRFLNVLEDARIEKRVQRKYPGLKKSFIISFNELMDRDFFGIESTPINSLMFIDRLNIHTKSQYTLSVDFNPIESNFLAKTKALETWEDVVALADEIWEYAKQEAEEKENPLTDDNHLFDEEDYDFSDGDGDSESDEHEESDGELNNPTTDDSDTDDAEDSNSHAKGTGRGQDEEEPNCITDENYRKNEVSLLDEKSKEYVYCNIPTPNLDVIFTPAKRVQELMTQFFEGEKEHWDQRSNVVEHIFDKRIFKPFKDANSKYVSLLAKEFEMRKAAKIFAKGRIAETGEIDINKLAGYKFDDNIFRKMTYVPKGKSHGLFILLDYSGSMADNIGGTIEQILVLTMFCRKVNIPFKVVAFSSELHTYLLDKGMTWDNYSSRNHDQDCFSKNVGDVFFESVNIREYLNSEMRNSEFNRAVKNMLLLAHSYKNHNARYKKAPHIGHPSSERLSSTPMIEGLVAIKPMILDFKKKHNIDNAHLIIMQDGDANATNTIIEEEGAKYHQPEVDNVVIQDLKHKFIQMVNPNEENYNKATPVYLDWFKQTTGSKVIGMFLVNPSRRHMAGAIHRFFPKTFRDINSFDKMFGELNKQNCTVAKPTGYDSFFLIKAGKELEITDEQMVITGDKVTSAKLKTALMKQNKKRQANRFLVNKFIAEIS